MINHVLNVYVMKEDKHLKKLCTLMMESLLHSDYMLGNESPKSRRLMNYLKNKFFIHAFLALKNLTTFFIYYWLLFLFL